MIIVDKTTSLTDFILKNFKYSVLLCQSFNGHIQQIGVNTGIKTKCRFLFWKYEKDKIEQYIDVIDCVSLIRIPKHKYHLYREEINEVIKKYEELTNYKVRIELVNHLYNSINKNKNKGIEPENPWPRK